MGAVGDDLEGRGPMGFLPPGMPPVGGSPTGAGALPSSQVTAGLVELAVYGIVSLYEKAKVKPVEPKVDPEPMPDPMKEPMKDPKKEPKAGDPPTPPTK